MKAFDVIIIGAGLSGIVAGVTAKKQNPEKSILIIEEEEKGLIPCGIPYIFHDLNDVDKNVPVIPTSIPGYDLTRVEYIPKSYNYIKNLKKKVDGVRNIVMLGGGFIGAEVAGQLALHADKTITIIESEAHSFNKSFSISDGEIINIIDMVIQNNVTVYEPVSHQIGTHPLLTSAPAKHEVIKAAEGIITKQNTCAA